MCKGNDEIPAPLRVICDAHSAILYLICSVGKVSHPGADDLFSYYINYLSPNKLNSLLDDPSFLTVSFLLEKKEKVRLSEGNPRF